ncbi:MAG TPA: hypothetical protein VHO26_12780 [Propionibacteriaceae bacterium]|nr:hypothetical protein [Propionibacteriaceae bacterium]
MLRAIRDALTAVPRDDPRTPGQGLSVEQQQRALFVTDRGTGFGALDVIEDGLRGGRARTPALTWILDTSPWPYFRVVAAMVLTAWGDRHALETVLAWAQDPVDTPPDLQTDSQDVFSRCDNGFELLCSGVGTRVDGEPEEIRALRVSALRAFIVLSPYYYVGRAIPRALDDLRLTWREVADVVDFAIHEALDRLARRLGTECDLGFQSAVLVGLLARHNEAAGARAAQVLLDLRPGPRADRELILALGGAGGRDTSALLHELLGAEPARAKLAEEALRARSHPYRRRPPRTPTPAQR